VIVLLTPLASCGGDRNPWVGTITSLGPPLCVGRFGANGHCFAGIMPSQQAELRIGECVDVTFTSRANEPFLLRSIKPYPAERDRQDCPTPTR
jgi:hypothetical protein